MAGDRDRFHAEAEQILKFLRDIRFWIDPPPIFHRRKWHDWFAWHPVKTEDGWWIWLEKVRRVFVLAHAFPEASHYEYLRKSSLVLIPDNVMSSEKLTAISQGRFVAALPDLFGQATLLAAYAFVIATLVSPFWYIGLWAMAVTYVICSLAGIMTLILRRERGRFNELLKMYTELCDKLDEAERWVDICTGRKRNPR